MLINKVLCPWSWAALQAPAITVVRLDIGSHSVRSCMVGLISYKERVKYNRGNNSQKKRK